MQIVCTGKTALSDTRISVCHCPSFAESKAYGKLGAQPLGYCRAPSEPEGFFRVEGSDSVSPHVHATVDGDKDFARNSPGHPIERIREYGGHAAISTKMDSGTCH